MTNNELVEKEDFREKVGIMVDDLVKMDNKDKDKISEDNDIVKQLRKINKEILSHKIIADQYTIYPIWVEAYYNNTNTNINFIDNSCHNVSTIPSQFEFRKHKTGYGGVDLYLGKSNDHYLSFLIKLALIKVEGNKELKLCSQVQIKDEIIDYLENEKFKNKLNYHLKKIDLGLHLGDYASDVKLRRIVEEYLNSQNINACLKDCLINRVGEKTKLTFSTTDLDKNGLNIFHFKRVNVNAKNNEKYNDLKLASFYWKNEEISKDKDPRAIYDELKKANRNGGNELYKLR